MRAPTWLLLSILVLVGGGIAVAHDPNDARYGGTYDHDHDYERMGVYIGGGPVGALNETPFEDDIRYSLGVEGRVGYRLQEHFALEAQVTYLHNNGDRLDDTSLSVDFETLSGTGNLKVFILTGRVQPYAVAGVGGSWVHEQSVVVEAHDEAPIHVKRNSSNALFTFRGGLGVDFYVDEHVLLYMEASYLGFTGQLDPGDGMIPFVLGAQFRF